MLEGLFLALSRSNRNRVRAGLVHLLKLSGAEIISVVSLTILLASAATMSGVETKL